MRDENTPPVNPMSLHPKPRSLQRPDVTENSVGTASGQLLAQSGTDAIKVQIEDPAPAVDVCTQDGMNDSSLDRHGDLHAKQMLMKEDPSQDGSRPQSSEWAVTPEQSDQAIDQVKSLFEAPNDEEVVEQTSFGTRTRQGRKYVLKKKIAAKAKKSESTNRVRKPSGWSDSLESKSLQFLRGIWRCDGLL